MRIGKKGRWIQRCIEGRKDTGVELRMTLRILLAFGGETGFLGRVEMFSSQTRQLWGGQVGIYPGTE